MYILISNFEIFYLGKLFHFHLLLSGKTFMSK